MAQAAPTATGAVYAYGVGAGPVHTERHAEGHKPDAGAY